MQLRLTVVDPAALRPSSLGQPSPDAAGTGQLDCFVVAPTGATLAELEPELLRLLGRTTGSFTHSSGPLRQQDVFGLPPLVDGSILTLDGSATRKPPALLELHVTAGPDAGAVHPLGPGEHTVGRGAAARIRVDDLDVSRLHAVLHVGHGPIAVADLDSTNGTYVDGVTVRRDRASIVPGQVLKLGGTSLQVAVPDPERAASRPDLEGHLEVNRPPRLFLQPDGVSLSAPSMASPREPARFPFLAAALPALAGVALVLITGSTSYLFFVLLSPVMVLGTFLTDRIGGRRSARAQRKVYDEQIAELEAAVALAVDSQSAARHHVHAAASALLLMAAGPQPRLWERAPADADFLEVRLGLGDMPADIDVSRGLSDALGSGNSGPDQNRPQLPRVPLTFSVRTSKVTGLAGPREQVMSSARFYVAQLAGWHSPRHLGLVILVGNKEAALQWRWARWLPHLRPAENEAADLLVGLDEQQVLARVGELERLMEARRELKLNRRELRTRAVVVVLDGAHELRRLPGVARLLQEGPDVGLFFLCLETEAVALPAECRSTIVHPGAASLGLEVTLEESAPFFVAPDGVSRSWAEGFARALAPLRDATPEDNGADLPGASRLLDLLPFDGCDPVPIGTAWRCTPRSTEVILGVGAAGATLRVDLDRDGPHALIAGTTGSGKSELLQTLVASLALGNRPDELSFVLIDYKGGAAFKDCARLPHTVGTVTDLDNDLTERALQSLGAELRRRERVLRAAGAKDLEDYRRTCEQGSLFPRLVLVVDEFATLAEELPDFLNGLVGIAQRGRSLGVHLVLATQRPGGVVSADIRANTALRIALRMTDPGESSDVIDSSDAAFISRTTPGRAIIHFGAGGQTPFQAARIGGRRTAAAAEAKAWRSNWYDAGDPPSLQPETDSGPSDLEQLVDAVRAAAVQLEVQPAPSPWLPPLPALITDETLEGAGEWCLPFGLLDLPGEQRRGTLALDLEHGGHLLIAGTALSGRSTALRTIAGSMARRLSSRDVHVYAIDGNAGALSSLAALPHCGAVVSCSEAARADRVLFRLAAEVQERLAALRSAGFASVAEQRAAVAPAAQLPWLLLLIDGWEAVQAAFDDVDHGRPLETLLRLVREGAAAGLRIVITGERGVLTSRIGAAISDRLLLRLADPADYGLAGIALRQVPATMPPGRAVVAQGAVAAQIALLAPDPAFPAQKAALLSIGAAATRRDAQGLTGPSDRRPMMVAALPRQVTHTDLYEVSESDRGPLWAPLGLGGDDLSVQGADLSEIAAFVIAGPPGSGRSTALLTLEHFLIERHASVAVVAGCRSPLRRLGNIDNGRRTQVAPDDPAELASLAASASTRGGSLVILIDDVEMLNETPMEQLLITLLQKGARPDLPANLGLVLTGSTSGMSSQFRGLAVEARRHRCGLLLGEVGPVEADLLGVRAPPNDEAPPGRGLLVVRGRGIPIQVGQVSQPPGELRSRHRTLGLLNSG